MTVFGAIIILIVFGGIALIIMKSLKKEESEKKDAALLLNKKSKALQKISENREQMQAKFEKLADRKNAGMLSIETSDRDRGQLSIKNKR